MKLTIPRKTGKFSFEAQGKTISQHLGRILELTKEASLSGSIVQHFIGSSNGQLFVLGYSSEVLGIEIIPNSALTGEGMASLDAEAVRNVLKSKAMTKFEYDDSLFSWSCGRSRGSFPTKTILPDTSIYCNQRLQLSSTEKPLPKAILACLTEGTKTVELRDVYKIESTLVTHLICKKDNPLFVMSYDRYHSATYTSDVICDRDFQVSMPTKLFQIVSKYTNDSETNAQFFVDSSGLRVVSDNFVLDLPPVQVNQGEVNSMLSLVDSMRLWSRFKLSSDSLTNIKDALSLTDPKGGSSFALDVNHDKKRLRLQMVSNRGNAEESLKLKDDKSTMGNFNAKVDPRLLGDVVKKLSGDVKVEVFGRGQESEPSVIRLSSESEGKKIGCWSSLL